MQPTTAPTFGYPPYRHRVPAEVVAARVVQAVARGERDVYTTWRDRLLCWAGTRLPGLADWAVKRAYNLQAGR